MKTGGSKRLLPILYFISPAFVVYTTFMVWPIFSSIRIALFNVVDHRVAFVGLENFRLLFTSHAWYSAFVNALKNSLVFVAVNMFIQNPLAIFIATILSTKIKGSVAYRTAIFTPAVLSLVIVGFIWEMILSPLWGLPAAILGSIGLAKLAIPFLGLASTALITMALISAWQYFGVPVSLYFASLISIPDSLLEAAVIDGATNRRVFWAIRLPMILPMIGVISLLTYIANLSAFDIVFTIKGEAAGPDFSTDTLMTLFFRTFYGYMGSPGDQYMGATIAAAMLVILLLGVFAYLMWRSRTTTYEY